MSKYVVTYEVSNARIHKAPYRNKIYEATGIRDLFTKLNQDFINKESIIQIEQVKEMPNEIR